MTDSRKCLISLFVVVSLLCGAGAARAASFEELRPFLALQHFDWREYENGNRLLKEDGALYSAGALFGIRFDSGVTIKAKAELFGGEMDYDGQTQKDQFGSTEPVSTDVNYFGIREEVDGGYRFTLPRGSVEPFGGLGYRWWLRDLQNSTTRFGQPVYGYTETWQTLYARFGARGRYDLGSGWGLFAEGGGKYPLYTGNSVDFTNSGTVTFRPGAKLSGFAEAGVSYRHLKATFNYEGFRFSESPVKTVRGERFYQPESSSDIIGVSVGWNFR